MAAVGAGTRTLVAEQTNGRAFGQEIASLCTNLVEDLRDWLGVSLLPPFYPTDVERADGIQKLAQRGSSEMPVTEMPVDCTVFPVTGFPGCQTTDFERCATVEVSLSFWRILLPFWPVATVLRG
jgi:hypothetical protein